MKKTWTAIILLLSYNSFANSLPFCSDFRVVLSPIPLECQEDPIKLDFDIPELKINEKDLNEIFKENEQKLGSESSGGSQIDPSASQTQRNQYPSNINLSCELRVISDGQKSLRYLSIQSFNLITNKYNVSPYNFDHFLIKDNSFFPYQKFPVTQPPSVELGNYIVKMRENLSRNEITVKLCERKEENNYTCTSRVRNKNHFKSLILKLESISKVSETFEISKSLRLSCKNI